MFLVSGQCLGLQKTLLLQLKNRFKFHPILPTKLLKWNQTSNCCSWKGVSGKEGLVTHLDLSNEHIFGGLDNACILFDLQHVYSLDLSLSNFSTTIPSRLGKLTKLSYLNLSNSGFVGHIPISISAEFHKRSDIQHLVMINTKFSGELPTSIGNLSNMFTLELANCQFNGTLTDSLTALTKLIHIDLSFNQFYGLIPYSLFSISSLQEISLSHNKFSGQLHEFPNASSSVLHTLDLNTNNLERRIPISFFKLGKLRFNKFNGSMKFEYDSSSVSKISTLKLASCKLKTFPYLKHLSRLSPFGFVRQPNW